MITWHKGSVMRWVGYMAIAAFLVVVAAYLEAVVETDRAFRGAVHDET